MAAPRPKPYVHEAAISLEEGADPAAVGAAVTTELCGAAEHDEPCRWPHNTVIDPGEDGAAVRTVFVALESEEREVRTRIRWALRSSDQWVVNSDRVGPLGPGERALATRLVRTSQQAGQGPHSSLLSGSNAAPRERQLPLTFFSVVLGLWVATWCGVYLLV